MSNDQDHADDPGHLPSLSSKSREQSSLQDMYRRTLAAYWTAQPGELAADECIEDIFAGGDGWGNQGKSLPSSDRAQSSHPTHHGGDNSRKHHDAKSNFAEWLEKNKEERHHERHSSGESTMRTRSDKRREAKDRRMGHPGEDFSKDMEGSDGRRGRFEFEEEDVREDLKSWIIHPSKAS